MMKKEERVLSKRLRIYTLSHRLFYPIMMRLGLEQQAGILKKDMLI